MSESKRMEQRYVCVYVSMCVYVCMCVCVCVCVCMKFAEGG